MDARQVWSAALDRLRRRTSPGAFTTWFAGTIGVELRERQLTVSAPTTFACQHLSQRFHELARVAVSEVLGQSTRLAFVVRESDPQPGGRSSAASVTAQPRRRQQPRGVSQQQVARVAVPHAAPRATTPHPRIMQPPLVAERDPGHQQADALHAQQPKIRGYSTYPPITHEQQDPYALQPRYTFESFVVGATNRLAYAAAQEVARAPGEQYNPLLFFGGVGLGKTHLLHAIGQHARTRGLSVAYITAERFTNDIVEAIRTHTTNAFRAHYRMVDVLLVDDIQFIAGKEATEEEFFHTFNALHEANKQIVLSSDRVPREMRHLHDRLRSRFEWGLIADIQPPDVEQRLAILRAKAAVLHIDVPEDVLAALASPACESIRALEGALNRVIAHASMLRQPLNVSLVAQALAPLAGSDPTAARRPVDPPAILEAVARHYHVSLAELSGKTREHSIAWARQVAMYLLREETPISLPRIGQHLGGRDHTTIMHGCARVGQALAHDERTRADIASILASLRTT
ncbi:MAG TPA: chromosomal replication initiator protein DnaA [Ktedonobacterales bacterium]